MDRRTGIVLLIVAILLGCLPCIIWVVRITEVQAVERYLRGVSNKAHVAKLTAGSYEYILTNDTRSEFVPDPLGYAESPKVILNVNDKGKVAILWKKRIVWQGNYEGYVFHDDDYALSIKTTPIYNRDVIAVDFETMYPVIKKRILPNLLEVYFDLL